MTEVLNVKDARAKMRRETKEFLKFLCEKYSIDYNDKKAIVAKFSLVLKIKHKATIDDYLSDKPELYPEDGFVFLATMKGEDNIVSRGEIYNSKFEFLSSRTY